MNTHRITWNEGEQGEKSHPFVAKGEQEQDARSLYHRLCKNPAVSNLKIERIWHRPCAKAI